MKSLLIALVLVVVLFLIGCGTRKRFDGAQVFQNFENGLTAMQGITRDELFGILGFPDEQMQLDDETTVYTWSRNTIDTYSSPQVNTTRGYVGSVPVYGTTTSYNTTYANYTCSLKYTVTNGIAINWSYSGNIGGCAPYITNVNKYMKSQTQILN